MVNLDNTISYIPNPDFNGTDLIVYELCDQDGLCDTASVTITVNPVNDDPIAVDDNTTTTYLTPVDIALISNDSDVDMDTLVITNTSNPSNGAVLCGAT